MGVSHFFPILFMDRSRLNKIAETALEAFWDSVAEQCPEIMTGDEVPMAQFEEKSKKAIQEWHFNNSNY